MDAPRPTGSRLCLIHGNSLPERVDPVEGERVTVDAGGAQPVEATDGGDIVAIPRHGFDRSIRCPPDRPPRERPRGLRARL